MTPLFFTTHYQQTTMSHQLPDEYWDSLGPNGPFLHELFHNQLQLVAQLQVTNNGLQTQVMDAPDDIANAASQVALAVARFLFDSNPIQNKSPARRTLYLVVSVMQSFEATCWLPKTKHKTILEQFFQC